MNFHYFSGSYKQRGVVLLTGLTMLLLLTLLGVSGLQMISLEERMASNMRDRNLAFQASESALRDAEAFILTLPDLTLFANNTSGLYDIDAPVPADLFDSNTWNSNFKTYSGFIPSVAEQPRYFVKVLSVIKEQQAKNIGGYGRGGAKPKQTGLFRITARGVGGSTRSQVILRSHFAKSF